MLRFHENTYDYDKLETYNIKISRLIEDKASPSRLASAYHERGTYLSRLSSHIEAILDFNKALELTQENNHRILRIRGIQYLIIGNIEQAMADFTNAIRCTPDDSRELTAICFYMRGMAKEKLGHYSNKEIISDFYSALLANPDKRYVLTCYKQYQPAHSPAVASFLSSQLKEFFPEQKKVVQQARMAPAPSPTLFRAAPIQQPYVAPPVAEPIQAAPPPSNYNPFRRTPMHEKMNYNSVAEYQQDCYKAWKG